MLTDASIEGKIDRLLGPEGERDHRQADPGGDRPEALPRDRDRPAEARSRASDYEREALLAALEEIGADGGGVDSPTST